MPFTKQKAVAFTECPWASLSFHAKQYSPYGIGFKKEKVFAQGGGPAIYIRQDLFDAQLTNFSHMQNPSWKGFENKLYSFLTPFVPAYAPPAHLATYWKGRNPVDYSHEREWRSPNDLAFTKDEIEFIVVKTHSDLASFAFLINRGFPVEKFLVMDVQDQIETLWPIRA